MKKILASLALFSFLTVTACNTATEFNPALQNQDYSSLSKTKNTFKVNADWFDSLSPELQTYYAAAKGKTGNDLFDALHTIISENNHIIGYGDSKSYMYATADNTSVNGNGKPGLIDAYSGIFAPGSGGNGGSYKESGDSNKDGVSGDSINCEHTWPQSFFNKAMPMVGDLHHLQSTMSIPNNRRSHFPFGEVPQSSVIYSTSGGSKLGVTEKPGQLKITPAAAKKIFALPQEEADKVLDAQSYPTFEPMDAQKGNTARCLMYFMLRYHDQSNIRQATFDNNNFWVSKVPTFTKWSEQVDPINDTDRKRNDLIFKKQGNRNPFIDIPNLASIIGAEVLESK